MVLWFLDSLHETLFALRTPLTWLGLACLLALVVTVVLRLAFPGALPRLASAWPGARALLRWVWPPLALLACVGALGLASRFVAHRLSGEANAGTVNQPDPDGSPTVQTAPTATYLVTRTYAKSLTLPPEFVKRVGPEGVALLGQYLDDPGSDNVLRQVDRFRRRGRDVVLNHQVTQASEVPIRMDASRIRVDLNFVNSARQGSSYAADFAATYSFQNPLGRPLNARFRFPLPEGSGTLSNFRIVVNGRELSAEQLAAETQWEGLLAPKQTVEVHVTYRHQGARGWSYALAGRREPIRNFDLSLTTDQPAKFLRYSLYPTGIRRSLGGRQTLRWNLPNALTAQDVSLSFSTRSTRETAAKFYAFAPLALLLAVLLGVLWSAARGHRPEPARLALSILGVTAGLVLGGVLMSYLSLPLAGLCGAVVSLLLGLRPLGPALWPPVLLAALTPLAFLSGGHAGLLLALLATLLLGMLIFLPRPRAGLRPT